VQDEVYKQISEVGRLISELFQDDDPTKKERRPIRDWLDKLLHSDSNNKDQKNQSVPLLRTISTSPGFG